MAGDVDLSARAAGRALGCSHTYLLRLAREKRIPRNANGTFNVPAVRAALAAITDPAQVRHGALNRWKQAGDEPVTSAATVTTDDDAREAVALVARVLAEEGIATDGPVTIDAARTAETILKARMRDLQIAQKRGELVLLASVRTHVEKAFIGYRQAIQRLPSRYAAQIAASVGCNPVELDAALSKAIGDTLTELSSPVVRA